MAKEDRSPHGEAAKKSAGSRSSAGQRPEPSVPSARDVPSVGNVPAGEIRSVDLEPRSNGETEWQDEPDGPATSPSDKPKGG